MMLLIDKDGLKKTDDLSEHERREVEFIAAVIEEWAEPTNAAPALAETIIRAYRDAEKYIGVPYKRDPLEIDEALREYLPIRFMAGSCPDSELVKAALGPYRP